MPVTRVGAATVAMAVLLLTPLASGCSGARSTPQGTEAARPAEPGTRGAEGTSSVPAWPDVALVTVTEGLDQPLAVTGAGDGSGRLFVAEKSGRVRVISGKDRTPQVFLDLSNEVSTGGEQGLLGLAFSPGFASDGVFFTNHTDRRGDTVVTRFRLASPDDESAAGAARDTVLRVPQPYANHNGGCIAFGPDGQLYVGMGDGGAAGDPHGNGQDPRSLLGKMLKLDVSGSGSPKPEVWAKGLRNPWRFTFDPVTGDLWIGDVGQGDAEEVDMLPAGTPAGSNLGWSLYEGTLPFPPGAKRSPEGLVMPVAEYGRSSGRSVTGGVVYRGDAIPGLRGVYLFGDFVSGKLWGLRAATGGGWEKRELASTGLLISSFGTDESGEAYICDLGGSVLRIVER